MSGLCKPVSSSILAVNSLGFHRVGGCAPVCNNSPVHVQICFQVNAGTTVTIESSCPAQCVDGVIGTTLWTGILENSWGA